MIFTLTSYGQTLLATQGPPATLTYVVGTGVAYTVDPDDTAIHGASLATGTTGTVGIQQGIPVYAINLNSAVLNGAPFGEIGLFNGEGNLVALGVATAAIQVTSGSIVLECAISTVGSAVITPVNNNFPAGYIQFKTTVDALPQAQLAVPNVYAILDNQMLAVAAIGSNQWNLIGGTIIGDSALEAGSTSSSVTFPTLVTSPLNSKVYIAVTSGANVGYLRSGIVTANPTGFLTVGFTNPFPYPAHPGSRIVAYSSAPGQSQLGVINAYTPSLVDITGGAIDGVVIGAENPGTAQFKSLQVSESTGLAAVTALTLDGVSIGSITAGPGKFLSLTSVGSTNLGSVIATSIDATPIGMTTPMSATVTALTSTETAVLAALEVQGSASIGSNLVVTGTTNLQGMASIANADVDFMVLHGGTVDGSAVGSNVASSGKFTTLRSTGAATLNSAVISTGLTVLGATTLTGNVTAGGSLAVTGTLTAASTTVTGGTINGTTVGASTPRSGAFTTLASTSPYVNTVPNGTAPMVLSSNTQVINLNASYLQGSTWHNPQPIGDGTPSSGAFTTLNTSGVATLATMSVTGSATVANNLEVGGAAEFTGGITADTLAVTSLTATGGTVNGTAIGNTTPSTGAFTSATVSGGVSVAGPGSFAGNVGIGGNLTITGNITASGVSTANNLVANSVAISGGTINGTPVGNTGPSTGSFTNVAASGQIISTVAQGIAPLVVSSSTLVSGLNAAQLTGKTWAEPGALGGVTPGSGAFTTLSTTGGLSVGGSATVTGTLSANNLSSSGATITGGTVNGSPVGNTAPSTGAFTTLTATTALISTVAQGNPPLQVSSTTQVALLNASALAGKTWADPGTIGGASPGVVNASTLNVSGNVMPTAGNSSNLGSAGTPFANVFTTNGVVQTSDRRYKKNIEPCDLGLDFVNALEPVKYKMMVDRGTARGTYAPGNQYHYGLIAQQLETVLAGRDCGALVVDETSGKYGIRYEELISTLILAIQQLDAKVSKAAV